MNNLYLLGGEKQVMTEERMSRPSIEDKFYYFYYRPQNYSKRQNEIGLWSSFSCPDEVDDLWQRIMIFSEQNGIRVAVSTRKQRLDKQKSKHLISFYCYDNRENIDFVSELVKNHFNFRTLKFIPFKNFQVEQEDEHKSVKKLFTVEELDNLSLIELRKIAKDVGIAHYSTTNKTPLCVKILETQKRFNP
jgi:hypothetical protein